MSCGCVYVELGSGEVEFLGEVTRKARKQRVCTECKRNIERGEFCETARGLEDGTPWVVRTCSDCLSIRDVFFCHGYAYNSILDDLRYHLEDVGGEVSSECILALTSQARDTVFGMIEKVWEEQC